MRVFQALLYGAGVILLVIAAVRPAPRVSLALVGAACALLAYALPTITHASS